MESILTLSMDDGAWRQCTLPTARGGLGIRLASDLAIPCFVSSYFSSIPIDTGFLPRDFVPKDVTDALGMWGTEFHNRVPPIDDQSQQKSWDDINSKRIFDDLSNRDDISECDHIRLTNVSNKDSSYWLQALPARQLGTCLEDVHFRLAVGLRLGMPLVNDHNCRCASSVRADRFGRHSLSCKSAAQSRSLRHYTLNDVVRRALAQAGVQCTMEPAHLAVNDGKRPDGLTNLPWWRGKHLIWDATVVDSYATTYRNAAMGEAGSVAKLAEMRKRNRYVDLLEEYFFVPLAFETSGKFGDDALALTKRIGQLISARTGEDRATSFVRQRLSVEIQRGNARSLMETLPSDIESDDLVHI
jgi:hypothetical protein